MSFFARKQEKELSSDQHRDPVVNLELISLNTCVEVKPREKLADAAHNGEMCSSTRIISLTEQDTCNDQPCEIGEFYPKVLTLTDHLIILQWSYGAKRSATSQIILTKPSRNTKMASSRKVI